MGVCTIRLFMTLIFIQIKLLVAGHHCRVYMILQAMQYERQLSEVFLTLDAIGLQQCSQKCLMRSKCQIISFDFHTFTCELGEDTLYRVVSSRNTTGTISRSTLLQFEEYLLTSCAGQSCNEDDVCIELSSGQSTCVSTIIYVATTTTTTTTTTSLSTTTPPPTTTTTTLLPTTTTTMLPPTTTTLPLTTTQTTEVLCGNLPSVLNAVAPSSVEKSVGTSLPYTCITEHVMTGNPEVTCQTNGQWSSPTFTCDPCDMNGFTYRQDVNVCYKLQLNTRFSNADAVAYCAQLGGRLAKVDTVEKMQLLASGLPSYTQIYVDGTDNAVENNWVYSDGTSVNMDLFNVGMPTINTGLNCMILQSNFALMAEIDCGLTRFVICDKEL